LGKYKNIPQYKIKGYKKSVDLSQKLSLKEILFLIQKFIKPKQYLILNFIFKKKWNFF